MIKMLPGVSVIVPCYNQAEFLAESVNSVIKQDYGNWECIIVNDGSNDNTEEVALELCKSDSRIHYLKKANGGLSAARNFGISNSNGEYILPLDADDKISPEYVRLCVEELDKNPDLSVVYCNSEFFGERNGLWLLPEFDIRLLAQDNMIFCTAMFRKVDWLRVGGYDEAMKYGMEDWELWISILKKGGNVKKLPVTGFFYRVKTGSMVEAISIEKKLFLYDHVCKKHIDFIIEQLGNPILNYTDKEKFKRKLDKITGRKMYKFLRTISRLFSSTDKKPVKFR
jgi:glycosyltransferase involved in cell wall biosynthesis